MNVKEELLSLAPPRDFTRRGFIVTVLAAGFAAAVRPIAAQTVIRTDGKGLVADEVKIPGSEIVIYPEAPHGFHADYRPSYRAGPAKDGWKRMRAWLRKHGVA